MQVYKKILVTIECSSGDMTILKHIAPLALQNRAQVYLLHVVHSHTLDQNRVLRERAESCIREYLEFLTEKGVDCNTVIREGEPEHQIVREIDTGNYDLVAMAIHGHTLIGKILYGSVSRSVKRKSTVPLLLLKQ